MAKRVGFTVPGKDLVDRVKQLISQRDVRRVCLIYEGKNLLEVPIAAGDPAAPASALAAPVLAALTAFSTLVKECTVEVEKVEDKE